MKKLFYILFLVLGSFSFAQNYTAEQVEKTTDAKIIANFIKYNPNHTRTQEFKRKLFAIINEDNSAISKSINKTEVSKTIAKNKSDGEVSEKNKKTAALLTHLLNDNSKSTEAYFHIINKTKCNIVMKISGKKVYNLTIPAQSNNYILIPKGTYTLTSNVCDANYSSTKKLEKDMEIILNSKRI